MSACEHPTCPMELRSLNEGHCGHDRCRIPEVRRNYESAFAAIGIAPPAAVCRGTKELHNSDRRSGLESRTGGVVRVRERP